MILDKKKSDKWKLDIFQLVAFALQRSYKLTVLCWVNFTATCLDPAQLTPYELLTSYKTFGTKQLNDFVDCDSEEEQIPGTDQLLTDDQDEREDEDEETEIDQLKDEVSDQIVGPGESLFIWRFSPCTSKCGPWSAIWEVPRFRGGRVCLCIPALPHLTPAITWRLISRYR